MLKHYAMILQDRIIAVENSTSEPHYPPDADGNPVVAVECDSEITINDVYYPETKTFKHIEEPTVEPLSETEQAILDTAVNAEYLICLADLGL